MSTIKLTPGERRYLAALRQLERKHEPFSHRKMCDRFGWNSVKASWDYMHQLIRKGLIDQHGSRLAFVVCPVLTAEGQRELARKAA